MNYKAKQTKPHSYCTYLFLNLLIATMGITYEKDPTESYNLDSVLSSLFVIVYYISVLFEIIPMIGRITLHTTNASYLFIQ